jgi:DNA-binding PadR family transcriptional regulator
LRPVTSAFLPLPVAEFHILVTLADAARHGYGIMSDVEARTSGEVRLGPGTLYSALRRMAERGLIEEASPPRGGDGDERRLFYRITALGRDVVVDEARRMETCVAMIRRTRLVTRLEPA